MGNLTSPVIKLLFNTLDTDEFGLFTDSVSSYENLVIKKHGLTIPWVDDNINTEKTKVCADGGSLKEEWLVVSDICPCEDCNYEYGFRINGSVRKPGVLNDKYYPEPRFYGSKLENVQDCSNGVMDADDVLAMEDEILEQIGNDEGAIVEGFRAYYVSDDDDTDTSTIVVTVDGVATTVTTAGDHSTPAITGESDMIADINGTAGLDAVVRAYRAVDDAHIWIVGLVNGDHSWTVTAGTDTTVQERYIVLKQKDVDTHFEVEDETGFLESITGRFFFVLNAADDSDADVDITVDGATTNVTGTDQADLAVDISAIAGLEATNDGDYCYVYDSFDGSFDNLRIALAAGSSLIIVGLVYDPNGRYEFMNSDDVFQEFMGQGGHGSLGAMKYVQNQPIDGALYCKYSIRQYGLVPSLSEGAGHHNVIATNVDIYVNADYIDDLLWDATNYMWEEDHATFTADTDFDGLLLAWMT